MELKMTKAQLNKQDVLNWIKGQKAAEEINRQDRVKFLLKLTPEQSLKIYLQLNQFGKHEYQYPSPLLVAMRELLKRYTASHPDKQ